MLDHHLKISIQRQYVRLGIRRHQLALRNYVLKRRRIADKIPLTTYTKQELKRLHHISGYPSVKAFKTLLRRTDGPSTDAKFSMVRENINNHCKICKEVSFELQRTTLKARPQKLGFNHSVQVNTFYTGGWPAIYMVEEATLVFSSCFFATSQQERFGNQFSRCGISFILVNMTTRSRLRICMDIKGIRASAKAFSIHLD